LLDAIAALAAEPASAAGASLRTCRAAPSKAAPGGMLQRLFERCAHEANAAAKGLFGSNRRPVGHLEIGFALDYGVTGGPLLRQFERRAVIKAAAATAVARFAAPFASALR
jgi:hypothetical protein